MKQDVMKMVSVVIPAFNAQDTISYCLDSLMAQEHAGSYEVIVVDDGSVDRTGELVARYERVKLVRQPNAGPAAARNTGAREAAGDIVLFLDSDCVAEKNWLTEMIKHLRNGTDVVGVKGRYKTKQRALIARFVQLEYEDKYLYMQQHEYIDFVDTYSAGFRRDVFLKMGGYDTDFPVACAEDIEFSYRLSSLGYKMLFNPEAVVYHLHPDNLTLYLKKKYKFAYWRVLAVRKNPQKLLKDTHTPQLMKVQLLFPPSVLGAMLLGSVFKGVYLLLPSALLLVFFLLSIPFLGKAMRKDFLAGLASPVLLFFRATAQFCGVVAGVLAQGSTLLRGK
jgi:glycosyltransferase involved in cell wall biosynthesis